MVKKPDVGPTQWEDTDSHSMSQSDSVEYQKGEYRTRNGRICSVSSGVRHSKCVSLITIPHICGCDVLPMGFEDEAGHSIRQKASEFQRGKDGDTLNLSLLWSQSWLGFLHLVSWDVEFSEQEQCFRTA